MKKNLCRALALLVLCMSPALPAGAEEAPGQPRLTGSAQAWMESFAGLASQLGASMDGGFAYQADTDRYYAADMAGGEGRVLLLVDGGDMPVSVRLAWTADAQDASLADRIGRFLSAAAVCAFATQPDGDMAREAEDWLRSLDAKLAGVLLMGEFSRELRVFGAAAYALEVLPAEGVLELAITPLGPEELAYPQATRDWFDAFAVQADQEGMPSQGRFVYVEETLPGMLLDVYALGRMGPGVAVKVTLGEDLFLRQIAVSLEGWELPPEELEEARARFEAAALAALGATDPALAGGELEAVLQALDLGASGRPALPEASLSEAAAGLWRYSLSVSPEAQSALFVIQPWAEGDEGLPSYGRLPGGLGRAHVTGKAL